MPTGCGHLKGTFHILLTFHLRKVIVELQLLLIKLLTRVYHRRLGFFHTVQDVNHLTDVVDTIHFQAIDHSRLTRILHRHKQRLQPHRAGLDGNGQCAFHRQNRAVKPQLTDEHILLGILKIQFFQCHHQANGHGKVKARAFLPHIGWCKVHHRLLHRHVVAIDIQCGKHPFLALLHSIVGQTHNDEMRHGAVGAVHLHRHRNGIQPLHGRSKQL